VDETAVAARVWPGKALELEPLGGGITNRNFKVVVDGEAYVLRIGGKDTELLGIDREAEHEASLAAAELGVGPDVVAFVKPEGYLVTRFVDGGPIPPEEMRQPALLRRAGQTLRRIHGGPRLRARFDSFRVVEAYAATAAAHGVAVPAEYDWAHGIAADVEGARRTAAERPCHNDLLNANFLAQGERMRIVDWEYAGMGDPFFDLANFSINHELAEDENVLLLEAYFGETRDADLDALRLMRFMSDFREAMWGVVQQGISELDFDFGAYARDHFARLRRTAASPEFEAALHAVA
jgi:thiamine kinase-like enzyme